MQTTICNIHFLSDDPESQSVNIRYIPCAYMLMKNGKIVKVGKTNQLGILLKKLKREMVQIDYVYAVYKSQYYQDLKKDNKVIALFHNIFRLSYEVQKEYDNMEAKHESK